MAGEETTNDDPRDASEGHAGGNENEPDAGENEKENKRPEDTLADNKKCPECGAPVDDVRATCIDCGYEYKDEDHEDPDASHDFVSGSQVDDEGNELPEHEEPPEESPTDEAESDEESSDE